MPLIERENKKKPQKISVCLSHEVYEELSLYCQFLDSSCDHVISGLIQATLPKDKDYLAWKSQPHHAEPASETLVKTETRGRKKNGKNKGSPQAISAVREPLSA